MKIVIKYFNIINIKTSLSSGENHDRGKKRNSPARRGALFFRGGPAAVRLRGEIRLLHGSEQSGPDGGNAQDAESADDPGESVNSLRESPPCANFSTWYNKKVNISTPFYSSQTRRKK